MEYSYEYEEEVNFLTKTNAMRLLDAAGIAYQTIEYEFDEQHPCGIGRDSLDADTAGRMFKTLVTRTESGGIVVFCLPVNGELDLKKCARAAGCKRVEMIHVKEITALTGYVRGGCSPVGMKKKYPVIIERSAVRYNQIFVSAGQRGVQMELSPADLIAFTGADCADLMR